MNINKIIQLNTSLLYLFYGKFQRLADTKDPKYCWSTGTYKKCIEANLMKNDIGIIIEVVELNNAIEINKQKCYTYNHTYQYPLVGKVFYKIYFKNLNRYFLLSTQQNKWLFKVIL